jgi:hypothetical protein
VYKEGENLLHLIKLNDIFIGTMNKLFSVWSLEKYIEVLIEGWIKDLSSE